MTPVIAITGCAQSDIVTKDRHPSSSDSHASVGRRSPWTRVQEVACMHNVGAIDRYRIGSMILRNEFSGATVPAPSLNRPGRDEM